MSLSDIVLDPKELGKVEHFKNVILNDDASEVDREIADKIAHIIRTKKNPVICFATGTSFRGVYSKLRKIVEEEKIDCSGLTTFNLDEYYPIERNNPNSFESHMEATLFETLKKYGLKEKNIHFPNPYQHFLDKGIDITKLTKEKQLSKIAGYCEKFERSIKRKGGIDIVLVGYGMDYHTNGFCFAPVDDEEDYFGLAQAEGGIDPDSRTRIVYIPETTRRVNNSLDNLEDMWQYATTMGHGTLTNAKEIIGVVSGINKNRVAEKIIEGEYDHSNPSHVQRAHMGDKVTLYVCGAGEELTRSIKPWVVAKEPFSLELSEQDKVKIIGYLCEKYNVKASELSGISQTQLKEEELPDSVRLDELAAIAHDYVAKRIISGSRDIPEGNYSVLVWSPHPDDGAFNFFAPETAFARAGIKVTQAAALNGYDAVRLSDIENLIANQERLEAALQMGIELPEGFNQQNLVEKLHQYMQGQYGLEQPRKGQSLEHPWLDLAQLVRYFEFRNEIRITNESLNLDIGLIWVDLPYYQTPNLIKPQYTEQDVERAVEVLEQANYPLVIAITDERDPNGNHEKANRVLYAAIRRINQTTEYKPTILGYCGSWVGKPIHTAHMFFPVDEELFNAQKEAASAHKSQENPKFGGESKLPFIARAERNMRGYKDSIVRLGIDTPEVIGYQLVSILNNDPQKLVSSFATQ